VTVQHAPGAWSPIPPATSPLARIPGAPYRPDRATPDEWPPGVVATTQVLLLSGDPFGGALLLTDASPLLLAVSTGDLPRQYRPGRAS
jgi:fermentation-respiration switch protein FrsA (DUF1100 family)